MPTNARSSGPKRSASKERLAECVATALRSAKAEGDYPPTVSGLFERLVATECPELPIRQLIADPRQLLKALGRAPLKNDGTIFARGLDAPVSLPEDQAGLVSSEQLMQHLAQKVRAKRAAGKEPKKRTVAAFVKDAQLSGKGLTSVATAIASRLEGLLAAQLRDGSRFPDWLSGLIEADSKVVTAHLLRVVEHASSAQSTTPYPVPESLLRSIRGADDTLDGKPAKSEFYSKVLSIQVPAATGAERRYLLGVDLSKVALVFFPAAVDSIGRRFPETSLFSADEIARELVDPASQLPRGGKQRSRAGSKPATKSMASANAVAEVAEAIEAAAGNRAIPPNIAWLFDKGSRRYFLRSKVEPSHDHVEPRPGVFSAATPVARPFATQDMTGFNTAFDRAFRDVTAGSGGRQIVLLSALRQKLAEFSREQFDEGLLRMWGQSYSLETANDRRSLAPTDLAAAIVKGEAEYVYVVRRS